MKSYYMHLFGVFLLAVAAVVLFFTSGAVLSYLGLPEAQYGRAFDAILTVVLGYAMIWLLARGILSYGKSRPRFDEGPIAKFVSMLGYVIIAFLVLALFQVNVTGLLVGAGFLGIVIGLASQSTLGNLFAGIAMMAAKPFAVGDRVTFSTWQYGMLPPSYSHRAMLPGYSGKVHEIGLMYTKLVLDDGTALFVPNGVMNQAVIINYTVSDVIQINFRVELPTSVDFAGFRRSIMNEMEKHKKLKDNMKAKPEVLLTDIGTNAYGVDIRTSSTVEREAYVKAELSSLAFRVVSKSIAE
ncbi:MAG: mechanosensitive ion channel family protein [Candidatus Marsarchaeota archaeon]|nr:mechanosensitive ion channel family protein [Candidatus Marsarchaeota archaeon]